MAVWTMAIFGYGCYLTPELTTYLDQIIEFTKIHIVRAIILTGGYTSKKRADVSEAILMQQYLAQRGIRTLFLLDNTAITTNQNLLAVGQIMSEYQSDLEGTRVIFFCDHSHRWKIKIVTRLLLGFWPETRTAPIIKGWINNIKQLLVATPLNILASQILFFEQLELKRKQKIIRQN